MATVTVGSENGHDIKLYYEDHGSGPAVVLIHGYPLDGRSWEKQQRALLDAGFRVIAYDRRGFGMSSKPSVGYDYDTLAADLNALLEELDLRDVVLVGFSMGTGEVIRYLGRFGASRVRKAVLLAPLQPYLLKTDDNPEGVDQAVFEKNKSTILADRYVYLKQFLDDFYNVDKLRGARVSDETWQAAFHTATHASPYATHACVDSWLTDFRDDVAATDLPVLVVQGTEDRILPYPSTGKRLAPLMKDVRVVPIEGAPHNIGWTHSDEVNRELVAFLRD